LNINSVIIRNHIQLKIRVKNTATHIAHYVLDLFANKDTLKSNLRSNSQTYSL